MQFMECHQKGLSYTDLFVIPKAYIPSLDFSVMVCIPKHGSTSYWWYLLKDLGKIFALLRTHVYTSDFFCCQMGKISFIEP